MAATEAIERPVTVDLDEAFYAVSGAYSSATNASTVLGGRYRFPHLEIDVEIPFAVEATSSQVPVGFTSTGSIGSSTSAAFGNIAVAAYYTRSLSAVQIRVGGILALPTAPGEDLATMYGYPSSYFRGGNADLLGEAAWSRGFDRLWLWQRHAFTPLGASFRVGTKEDSVFQESTELVVAPMVLLDGSGDDYASIQLSEEVGAHASLFRGGLRGEVVGIVGGSPFSGMAQISALPFAGVDGKWGYADMGALFNLDDPAHYTYDTSVHWGLRLRGGARF